MYGADLFRESPRLGNEKVVNQIVRGMLLGKYNENLRWIEFARAQGVALRRLRFLNLIRAGGLVYILIKLRKYLNHRRAIS